MGHLHRWRTKHARRSSSEILRAYGSLCSGCAKWLPRKTRSRQMLLRALSWQARSLIGAEASISLRRQPDGTYLSRAGGRRRPVRAVCNLLGGRSCPHRRPATAFACRRLCEDVQPRLSCRAESLRDYSELIGAVVLEELAMDAAVHDQAIEQDETRATVARSLPSVGDASARQTSELDDVARRVSEGYPNNKP